MNHEVTRSEKFFQGKVFDIRVDHVRNSEGRETRVDIVEHNGAVVLVPIDKEERFWFVRQYRHAAGEDLLELPAGTLIPGEEPEICAIRECREEIGLNPRDLTSLSGAYLAPGYSTEFLHYFLARDLSHDPLDPDEDEYLHVETYSWDQIIELISNNQIRDSKSLAGLFLAHLFLLEQGS